ncbi:RNA polymerase sigma factor SigJ [Mycolicibacterium farcinogenes]|nr:RNA polymerase sigma factor SigJ [Mycolicibacterium farcinogenes]
MTHPSAGNSDEHAERFTLLRPLLFTIAYEILGSATESDDVLQESYLRWAQVDLATVTDTKAYLAKLVTRQALNALRAESRRREEYVGPWLPEPLLLAPASFGDAGDPSADVVLAESVSMAMLVVLETLTPDERAVFVLREVFGFSHDEIASAIGKTSASVRQMAHRARNHVQSRRKRFDPVDPQVSTEVTQRFPRATTGDMAVLLELLAPDVVWTADSDGKRSAARRPVSGAQSVAKLVVGLMRFVHQGGRFEPTTYNNAPAFKLYLENSFEGVVTVEVVDGKITHFYAMRNPDKLTGIDIPRVISR